MHQECLDTPQLNPALRKSSKLYTLIMGWRREPRRGTNPEPPASKPAPRRPEARERGNMKREKNLGEWRTVGGQARKAKYREANNAHAQYHKENGYSTCTEPPKFRCDIDAKAMVRKHLQWLIDKGAEESEIESARIALEEWKPLRQRGVIMPGTRYIKHSQKSRDVRARRHQQ